MNDVLGMQKHNQRESNNSKNIDIDKSRSELNYDLHNDENINYKQRIDNIIKENYTGKKAIRKDAVVMTSTIITSDREFFDHLGEKETRRFFEESYNKLKDKYGEQNIVSACVHMDEKTPHMHLIAVPITQEGKLSAKECFSRESLRNLQDEIPKHLQSQGFAIDRGKENSPNKHIEIHEYKKQTLERVNQELDKDFKELENIKANLQNIKEIEYNKIPLTGRITMKEEDFKKLTEMAQKGLEYKRQNADYEIEIRRLSNHNEYLDKTADLQCSRANSAISQKKELSNQVNSMTKDINNLKLQNKAMGKTLNNHCLLEVAQRVFEELQKSQEITKTQQINKGMERSRDRGFSR